MKANRKFVQADEAVSPVIAVILMVAITVVLAATVFVLVSDIGSNTGSSTPAISWSLDESADRISVTTAAQNADWSRLTLQVDSCTPSAAAQRVYMGSVASPWQNKAALTSGGALMDATGTASACGAATAVRVTTSATKVSAGDYLALCQGPLAAPDNALTNVKIMVKDTTANAVVTSHTFTNIAECTA